MKAKCISVNFNPLMKEEEKKIEIKKNDYVSKDEDRDRRITDDDEMVMIMMPKITFNAFEDLAKNYRGSVAQTISVALKLLEKKLKEGEK